MGSKANELRAGLGLGCACQLPVGRGMRKVQILPKPSLVSLGGVEVLIMLMQGRGGILSRKGKEERVCGCGAAAKDRLWSIMGDVQAKCSSEVDEHQKVVLL